MSTNENDVIYEIILTVGFDSIPTQFIINLLAPVGLPAARNVHMYIKLFVHECRLMSMFKDKIYHVESSYAYFISPGDILFLYAVLAQF